MNSKPQKLILSVDDNNYLNWKLSLEKELEKINPNNIEIEFRNLDLSCKDIVDSIEIARQYSCEILSFCSTSAKTIISCQSLGYSSQLIIEDNLYNI